MIKKIKDAMVLPILLGILILLGFGLRGALLTFYRSAYPIHYSEIVFRESAYNNLDPSFVFAVIRTESGFDSGAVSVADAKGLMQIIEDTFE